MKYSDLPPKGTIVRIIWQDSGQYKEPGCDAVPSDMSIGTDEIFARIVRRSKKHNEITVAMRKPSHPTKLDSANDFYMTFKVDSIRKLFVLVAVAEFA